MKAKFIAFTKSSRVRKFSAYAAVLILLLTGMSSSTERSTSAPEYNAALDRAVGSIEQTGGLLKVGSVRECDSLDPVQTFDSWCGVIQRLFTRNLLSYSGKPGTAGLEPVPDLAVASPVVTEENKVWTFTLRNDLKWQDGTSITSEDVKFSFARLFDDLLQSPVSNEILCLLSTCAIGSPDYLGPYVAEAGELPNITTPDEKTVVIRLTRSFAEFDKILATVNFGIISKKHDNNLRLAGVSYSDSPLASGPFKVSVENGVYKFVRNDQWNQDSDPIRFPLVDQIDWTIWRDTGALDDAVKNGDVDLRIDSGLGATGRSYALADKELRTQVDNPTIGYTNYLAILPNVAPLDRKPCREAIAFALNKTALAATHGGTDVSVVANSMTPTNIAGYQKNFNPYPTGKDFTGNLDAAKRKLTECGYPDGFTVKFAFAQLGTGPQVYSVLQQSLGQIGIVVEALPFDDFATYLTTGIGSPENARTNGVGLVALGWAPDFNSPLSFWAPLVDGRKIKVMNNQNLPQISDNEINALLDSIEFGQTEDFAGVNKKIEELVAQTVTYIPISSDNVILFRPSYLSNVYVQQALGSNYDLVNIGINPKPDE
ncbi:MAG: hypothetical protein RIS61_1016 [Actinomycetota bacterium]